MCGDAPRLASRWLMASIMNSRQSAMQADQRRSDTGIVCARKSRVQSTTTSQMREARTTDETPTSRRGIASGTGIALRREVNGPEAPSEPRTSVRGRVIVDASEHASAVGPERGHAGRDAAASGGRAASGGHAFAATDFSPSFRWAQPMTSHRGAIRNRRDRCPHATAGSPIAAGGHADLTTDLQSVVRTGAANNLAPKCDPELGAVVIHRNRRVHPPRNPRCIRAGPSRQ